MQPVESVVAKLPDFSGLESGLISRIAAASRLTELPAEAIICQQGAPPDALRYLLDGRAALTQRAVDGSRIVIDLALPVSGLVLASALADTPYLMAAQALTAVAVLEIAAAPIRQMMASVPSFATAMLRRVSLDSQSATSQVLDLKLHNSSQRLGCYLLSLVRFAPANRVEFRLPVQKRVLAAQLGCRFENLSRAFAILRDVGVETHGARVILHDIASLRSYSVPCEIVPPSAYPVAEARQRTAATSAAFSDAFRL